MNLREVFDDPDEWLSVVERALNLSLPYQQWLVVLDTIDGGILDFKDIMQVHMLLCTDEADIDTAETLLALRHRKHEADTERRRLLNDSST